MIVHELARYKILVGALQETKKIGFIELELVCTIISRQLVPVEGDVVQSGKRVAAGLRDLAIIACMETNSGKHGIHTVLVYLTFLQLPVDIMLCPNNDWRKYTDFLTIGYYHTFSLATSMLCVGHRTDHNDACME